MRKHFLTALLLLYAVSGLKAEKSAPILKLPFNDGDARYFFSYNDKLYLGDHTIRTLYTVNEKNVCEKVENLQGWYIRDATMFNGRILFCSSQRLLYKEQGKVVKVPVADTVDLSSISTDGQKLFLLDARNEGKNFFIVILDKNYKKTAEFISPGLNPLDIYYYNDYLWIYDQQDKCVHKIDPDTEQEVLRIHTGVGHSWSRGILFYRDTLYVHDRATSSLIPVIWKEQGNAALSCFYSADYTFRQISRNIGSAGTTKAEFRVPVPDDSPGTRFVNIKFQPEPDMVKADLFGQKLAYFHDIRIPPGGEHEISYNTSVVNASVQYTLPEMPLKALASIPEEIKTLYLRSDSYISLTDKGLMKASQEARLDTAGNEPAGVKSLIKNLVTWIIDRVEYNMDDTWDSADKIYTRGTGSCSEYSFLFSSLARLNGIPTRLAGGVQLDEAFHRWTEVWYPGTGWVPVDVTKIDSSDITSRDYEYLFGKTYREIPLSHIGTCDDSGLGVNYYIYRSYSGGKRERTTEVKMQSVTPLFVSGTVEIKNP